MVDLCLLTYVHGVITIDFHISPNELSWLFLRGVLLFKSSFKPGAVIAKDKETFAVQYPRSIIHDPVIRMSRAQPCLVSSRGI